LRFDKPVHFQIPILLTPGEILQANNIGVLPLEDINPGTVNLNLNAVVRNPKNINLFNEKLKKSERNLESLSNKPVTHKKKDQIESVKNESNIEENKKRKKFKFISKNRKNSFKYKKKISRNIKKNKKLKQISQASPISIEEKLEEHDWDLDENENMINPKKQKIQYNVLSKKMINFNRKKFTDNSLNDNQIFELESNFQFNYNLKKIKKKGKFRTTKSLKTKRIQSRKRKKQKTEILTQRIDEQELSEEYSGDSREDEKEPDMYSIEPQESLSKKAPERRRLQKHFYKPITSTMSIKSSNPILKSLNKNIKLKKLKPNVSFREPFGLEEETRDLGSNKSVKFSGKNSDRSKNDLFNISDNKSRLSNFSAELFPSNSNFTYDVNKIKKQLRTKNINFQETINNHENRQDETRSQSKLGNLKKNSFIIQRDFQKLDQANPSEDNFTSKEPQIIMNDNRKFKNVIYNNSRVSHQQLNIINMTLSVQNTDAHQFKVSREHHDSYTYSKNSIDRY
jgi:hypothetical protein